MYISKIDAVEREMQRLKDAIRALRTAHTERGANDATLPPNQRFWNVKRANEPYHTGAIKRASMDLTRALANLRKPD